MKRNEGGFTVIEMAVTLAIVALITGAAAMTIFQVIKSNERSNNHLAAVRQTQNAGFWLSRDAKIAENVATDGLEPNDFVLITWTERDYIHDPVYHSVTYSFREVSGDIAELWRSHWSSVGASEELMIAGGMYFNPDDPANSSNVTYERPTLTVRLTSNYGDHWESRQYRISHRPNL